MWNRGGEGWRVERSGFRNSSSQSVKLGLFWLSMGSFGSGVQFTRSE
jgi:hypothetical protein